MDISYFLCNLWHFFSCWLHHFLILLLPPQSFLLNGSSSCLSLFITLQKIFFLDFLFVASSFTKSHELYTTRCQNHSSSLPASTVKNPFLSGTMLPKIQLGRAHLYASVFFLYSVLQNGHNVGWPELKHSSWNKTWLWGWKLLTFTTWKLSEETATSLLPSCLFLLFFQRMRCPSSCLRNVHLLVLKPILMHCHKDLNQLLSCLNLS